jgi:hypothetical protein
VPPPVPEKTPLDGSTGGGGAEGWTTGVSSPPASRFGGKGWGAMDEEEDGGLFGKGGPGIRTAGTTAAGDVWGASATGGWQEEEEEDGPPSAGPSQIVSPPKPIMIKVLAACSHADQTVRAVSELCCANGRRRRAADAIVTRERDISPDPNPSRLQRLCR